MLNIFSYEIWFLLTSTGFLAGFVDSIAGGGGLITVPMLLTIGMPPHISLGTNKLAATFGSFNAARIFIRKNIVQIHLWKSVAIATAIGALIGVSVNHLLSSDFLDKVLPIIIISVAIYVGLYRPEKHHDHAYSRQFKPPRFSGTLFGNLLGFYDGCFGPGTGSFWTTAIMATYQLDLLTASGIARVMNFVSNFVALLTFMLLHNIHYGIGIMMGLGLLSGSYIGARAAIRFGASFIRPIFLTVVIVMALRVLWKTYTISFHTTTLMLPF